MRTILRKIKRTLLSRPDRTTTAIPCVDFANFVKVSELDVRIIEPAAANGNVTLAELLIINSLVKIRQPQAIFEIGTFDGRTTLNMASNSESMARVVTLDLPSKEMQTTRYPLEKLERQYVSKPESGERFSNRPEAQKITQLYGDSAQFDFSRYENLMDFVFVDASHAYEYVLNDSKIALRLLRQGKGLILWHDYDRIQWWPGVTKGLDELFRSDARFSKLVHFEGSSLVCLSCD